MNDDIAAGIEANVSTRWLIVVFILLGGALAYYRWNDHHQEWRSFLSDKASEAQTLGEWMRQLDIGVVDLRAGGFPASTIEPLQDFAEYLRVGQQSNWNTPVREVTYDAAEGMWQKHIPLVRRVVTNLAYPWHRIITGVLTAGLFAFGIAIGGFGRVSTRQSVLLVAIGGLAGVLGDEHINLMASLFK